MSWSYVWRGSLSLASTIALLNELTDEEFDYEDVRAIEAWLWGNTILWGPELFGPAITRFTGLQAIPFAAAVVGGYALGVAGTFAAIELTADSPEQKASMREDAKALFLPQFLGGESWEELDYFGTLWEGGKVVVDVITNELQKMWSITAPRELYWWWDEE